MNNNLPLQPNLREPSKNRKSIKTIVFMTTIILFLGFIQQNRISAATILSNYARPESQYLPTIERLITNAEKKIWIMQYVMRASDHKNDTVSALINLLENAKKRGVDVVVCLHSVDDKTEYGGPDNSACAKILKEKNITVVMAPKKRRMHSKMIIIDDSVIIGSHNWTYSALKRNTETSVLLQDKKALEDAEKVFTRLTSLPKKQ